MKKMIFVLALLFVFPVTAAIADGPPFAFCPGDEIVWICHNGGHRDATPDSFADEGSCGGEGMYVGVKACEKGHRVPPEYVVPEPTSGPEVDKDCSTESFTLLSPTCDDFPDKVELDYGNCGITSPEICTACGGEWDDGKCMEPEPGDG